MESALAWIGQIAGWIGQWIPRWTILDPTVDAVKYVKGVPKHCKGGRVHWWWPATTTFDTYPTARQADDLRSQTFMAADEDQDIVVVAGGMIVYEVVDIMKLLPTTYRASQAIKDIAITCIHSVCCELTWKELKAAQKSGKLDRKLKGEAQSALSDYGVRVLKVQLTDLTRARALKVFQSTSKDEE